MFSNIMDISETRVRNSWVELKKVLYMAAISNERLVHSGSYVAA